jgi:hypothetical protein
VSHHPPISAFYATNRQEGFTFAGTILAKSKFYGNSTSAILDGIATLSLLPRGEVRTKHFGPFKKTLMEYHTVPNYKLKFWQKNVFIIKSEGFFAIFYENIFSGGRAATYIVVLLAWASPLWLHNEI